MRGVYMKTEERIAAGKRKVGNVEGKRFKPTDKDFKREWRVRRAKKELIERFTLPYIRKVIAYAVVFSLALVVLIVIEATGYTEIIINFHASVLSSFEAVIAVITGLVGAVAAIVPSFKIAFASNTESTVSQGDSIFKEASKVKDKLGFLAKVKEELQELFNYLRDFEEEVGTKIVLVPIIDDLDRCITDGRNVKVLEAMQLILSVPGAPILSFLAVDSRIVVASIEDHYEKVFAKSNISGHEYLDKIVQLPFALPEPPPEKVERMMSKSLEGDAASPAQVAQRLKVFGTHGRQILTENKSRSRVTFTVVQANPSTTEVKARLLEPLVIVIEEFWKEQALVHLELNSKLALELVCAAARELGSHLKELAGKLQGNVYQEEAIEIFCRETNSALEAGRIGFEEVLTPQNIWPLIIVRVRAHVCEYLHAHSRRCFRRRRERSMLLQLKPTGRVRKSCICFKTWIPKRGRNIEHWC